MTPDVIRRGSSSGNWAASWPSWALLAFLFAQQMLFGADQPRLALLASVAALLTAALTLLISPRAQLPSPFVLIPFAGVLMLGVVQQLPLGQIGHPAWDYVQGRPIVTLDPWATRMEMVQWLGLGALFVIAMRIGRDDRLRPAFFHGFVICAAAYGLWAFADRILSPQMFLGVARTGYADRLTGSFLSANTAGTLFGLYLVVAAAAFAHALRRSKHAPPGRRFAKLAPSAGLFLISTACLMQTASRGAALASGATLLVALTLIAWDRSRRDRAAGAIFTVALGFIAAAAVILAVSGRNLADRMGTMDQAVQDRVQIYDGYWRAISDAPVFGYGLGAFHQINAMLAPSANPLPFINVGSAHNVYLQWLLEGGWTGLALMILTLAAIAAPLARGFVADRQTRPYVLMALGALMLTALHGLTDFALQIPSICALLTVLLGLAYGLCERGR